MVIEVKKPTALFPDVPRESKLVDSNGNITEVWKFYFDQTTLALQTLLKPEGYVFPQETAANISSLGNIAASVGNIIYDSTNNAFKGILLVSAGPPIVTVTKTFTLT